MSICLRPRPLKKGRTALTYWTCRKRQFRLQLLVHVPLFKMELWWVKFFSEHAVFISATHSTSKTEKQTFKAKTASTFYMVVSNKALIPYNMHTWNMILQKCCSRCITHLPHNAVVEEWDAFVCAAGFVHYFKLSLNFTYYHHITARYTLRQRIYLIKKHG